MRRHLRILGSRSVRATATESSGPLPGDGLIPEPLDSLTHAITINRCAGHVWPWLAQMGAGTRGGWYSYDMLDNGGRRSAERIVPDLQQLTPGMIFPALPGVTDGFTLIAFEPGRHLILVWLSQGRLMMSWAFVLIDGTGGSCRLIVRARVAAGYEFEDRPWWMTSWVGAAVHFVMQRKQLLRIKKRAESMAPGALVAADFPRAVYNDAA